VIAIQADVHHLFHCMIYVYLFPVYNLSELDIVCPR